MRAIIRFYMSPMRFFSPPPSSSSTRHLATWYALKCIRNDWSGVIVIWLNGVGIKMPAKSTWHWVSAEPSKPRMHGEWTKWAIMWMDLSDSTFCARWVDAGWWMWACTTWSSFMFEWCFNVAFGRLNWVNERDRERVQLNSVIGICEWNKANNDKSMNVCKMR